MIKYKIIEILELVKPDGGRYKVNSIEEAFEFCKQITISHYENFPVSSILIPKSIRKYVYSIYTFARIADDIADELSSIGIKAQIKALDDYENILTGKSTENMGNPVFLAINRTIEETNIKMESLQKLLTAFRMDIQFTQAGGFNDLEKYCFYSANPVGELILRLFNNYDETTSIYSDNICTGLQLANFWQDLSVDIKQNRVFIPLENLNKYDLKLNNQSELINNQNLINCLNELYLQTENKLREGINLIKYLKSKRLRLEIKITILGGLSIIKKCRNLGADIIRIRPEISKFDFIKLFFKALINNYI